MNVLYLSLAAGTFLFFLVCALLIRIRILHRSLKEIGKDFHDILATDTNTLVCVSTRDPYVLKLASDINRELRILREKRCRFQAGDRNLKEAVTGLSHDLRTPLTAIFGYLDLLEREEYSPDAARYLSMIRGRAEAMKDLTQELLQYSLAADVRPLSPERMDLKGALEESLVSFYDLIMEKGIEPHIELPEKPVWRDLDRESVSRIFSNITMNALRYSGGDFSVLMTEDGSITFSNRAPGLDPVSAGRLFDRFYTVSSGQSSTGLGLSIARTLTERLGGRISACCIENRLFIQVDFQDQ